MNMNEDPERLKNEEQKVLDALISQMDRVIRSFELQVQQYIEEAKNADISVNPDLYLAQLLAQKGKKDTAENRKKLLQARDELYNTRLLLEYDDDMGHGVEEIKVGLHSCMHDGKQYVVSWTMPLCRHYMLDNSSVEFESIVKGKFGEEFHTNYRLIVKNQVKLRFTHVKSAMNMFPGVFDDKTLKLVKKSGFLSDEYIDEMIRSFNPEEYNPEDAARIISDEFLQELLERRSTPEFKNIVFSIQKKQGEIIQAPYKRDMIVQGCAGSGKSMIMLHRLPILLYDNPTSLSRTNLYIITPSQMYIQLAENMRHQLEISDIHMGTAEQYYDICIGRYPGHKAGEYGKISYSRNIGSDKEKYAYSYECIEDIKKYYVELTDVKVSLEDAYEILKMREANKKIPNTMAQKVNARLIEIQRVLNANNDILVRRFEATKNVISSLRILSSTLAGRRDAMLREIAKMISKQEDEIGRAQKEKEKLDPKENAIAIKNRENIIEAAKKKILDLSEEKKEISEDEEYYSLLMEYSARISIMIKPFENLKKDFGQNTVKDIYDVIEKVESSAVAYLDLCKRLDGLEDKYLFYLKPISNDRDKVRQSITGLQALVENFLPYIYFQEIKAARAKLSEVSSNAVKMAYELIMMNIGVKKTESGNMRALKCSPYIYLQALYCFEGISSSSKESLLAIDEAQGFAPEEIRLLKNINGNDVVFNLYGDIHQHIEGTKGIDSWDDYSEFLDFDEYEMQENYRNASQITEYCNKTFGMNMIAINTPGKGVHELNTEEEFRDEMITQLMDARRSGLAAILVYDDSEARYILEEYLTYENKFHDMTNEDFSIHHTRWNIIKIDDAKGLEFESVIVLAGRMSRNQRYIAYTRALDDLFVYKNPVDIEKYARKEGKDREDSIKKEDKKQSRIRNDEKDHEETSASKHMIVSKKRDHSNSEVRAFFEKKGLKVVDKRDEGGRLWVIGDKSVIKGIVNEAISKFSISGKYATSKDIKKQPGWCTKTDK